MHIPRHGLMGRSMFGRSEPDCSRGVTRDLAMSNLAIDSEPRGCDVVTLSRMLLQNGYAIDRCFAFDRMVESWFRTIKLRARARVSPLAPRGSRATPTRCSQTLRETIARRR
jgi:hypothetical protein